MYKLECKISLFLFLLVLPSIWSSEGDNSPFYRNCVKTCRKTNCTQTELSTKDTKEYTCYKKGIKYLPETAKLQDKWSRLLSWDCWDDCSYHCMWKTVQGFQDRGYEIPKFHGKWPFKRINGIQEPASAFASMLNLLCHVYMFQEIRKEFSAEETPVILFWHVFVLICANGWVWSMIFHTRDIPMTESMDYACALSMIMVLLMAATVRIFHRKKKLVIAIFIAVITFYLNYTSYIFCKQVDYSYNMSVNIMFGVAGSLMWLIWAFIQLKRGKYYVWRLIAFISLSGMALTLEIFDFPPRHGWDAHALWHLSTAPLPILFYRFVIDDMKSLFSPLSTGKGDLKIT